MKAVSLTVDGKRIKAAPGTTILEAARESGIEIPTLCYHPRLRPLGHCRLCVVEVEGVAAPVTSCDHAVQEGMVVTTSTPHLEAIRREIISLLLCDHPYEDCLTCEKSGACDLQEKAYSLQVELPALIRDLPVTRDDNPYIVRDEAKCILCGRCLRVCRDYAGRNVFGLLSGGIESRITPVHEGEAASLEEAGCIFCGQCVDVCPVGALTERERAHAGREWELCPYDGVCLECSLGCSVRRSFAGEKLVRVSGASGGEDSGLLCQKGKFNALHEGKNDLLTAPLIRGEEGFREASYEEALRACSSAFEEIKIRKGPAALAVVAGGRCSNEESYLLQKMARGIMETAHVDLGLKPALAEAFCALEAVTGPDVPGPATGDLPEAEAIFVIGKGLARTNPVAAMAVEQACRLGSAVLVQIAAGLTGKEFIAWEQLMLQPREGGAADLFRALTALLREQPAAELAAAAGLEEADLVRAAELLRRKKSVILVCPTFYEEAGGEGMAGLLEAAGAAGALERGRSNILLLAEEGNARGIIEAGGAPGLLPGYARLNGKAGLNREQILAAAEAGEIRGLFAVLDGFAGPLPPGLEYLAVQCASRSDIPAEANVVFPAPPLHLKEGTFTGSDGERRQNLSAPGAAGGILPEWRVIAALSSLMGASPVYGSLQDIQAEIRRLMEGR